MTGIAVSLMLLSLLSNLLFVPSAAIQTEMQQLDGQSRIQSPDPDIPNITGPFFVEITAVVFDLSQSWQRFFDFSYENSNGDSSHHIALLRHSDSNTVVFQYQDDNDDEEWIAVDEVLTLSLIHISEPTRPY